MFSTGFPLNNNSKIFARALTSGGGTKIVLSNLPGRLSAVSTNHDTFVAPKIIIDVLSEPSLLLTHSSRQHH